VLGDFGRYLEQCDEKFDVLIASGVLYHMSEPVRLLENAAKVTNHIGLWTHYYDPEIINDREDLRQPAACINIAILYCSVRPVCRREGR
jgi:hypothetical protein